MTEESKGVRPEWPREGATDTEFALFFTYHIGRPCEVEVLPGVRENIRAFYIREAKAAMRNFTNENAKLFSRQ